MELPSSLISMCNCLFMLLHIECIFLCIILYCIVYLEMNFISIPLVVDTNSLHLMFVTYVYLGFHCI